MGRHGRRKKNVGGREFQIATNFGAWEIKNGRA
jgi:hypothetical protein